MRERFLQQPRWVMALIWLAAVAAMAICVTWAGTHPGMTILYHLFAAVHLLLVGGGMAFVAGNAPDWKQGLLWGLAAGAAAAVVFYGAALLMGLGYTLGTALRAAGIDLVCLYLPIALLLYLWERPLPARPREKTR